MPASARPFMTTFATLRSTQSALSTDETSMGGWAIWTPMKMAPATAAARPAARVRPAGVMVMTVLLGLRGDRAVPA